MAVCLCPVGAAGRSSRSWLGRVLTTNSLPFPVALHDANAPSAISLDVALSLLSGVWAASGAFLIFNFNLLYLIYLLPPGKPIVQHSCGLAGVAPVVSLFVLFESVLPICFPRYSAVLPYRNTMTLVFSTCRCVYYCICHLSLVDLS